MSNGKAWTASDTAEMAILTGRGWSDSRIARKLGFAAITVFYRRQALGLSPGRGKDGDDLNFPLENQI